jgi:hypothetical protein
VGNLARRASSSMKLKNANDLARVDLVGHTSCSYGVWRPMAALYWRHKSVARRHILPTTLGCLHTSR